MDMELCGELDCNAWDGYLPFFIMIARSTAERSDKDEAALIFRGQRTLVSSYCK